MAAIPMSLEDISALAKAYPDREDWRRISIDANNNLLVPDDLVAKVRSVNMVAARKTRLIDYANHRQWVIATGGRTIKVGDVDVFFPTTEAALAVVSSKAARLQNSINWQIAADKFVQIPAADFGAISDALQDFVQRTFDALPPLFDRIANGSVTTEKQVDAELAALI